MHLTTLLPMGKSLVLPTGENNPSQLGLYHTLQAKMFALHHRGKRVTETLVFLKASNPLIPAEKEKEPEAKM